MNTRQKTLLEKLRSTGEVKIAGEALHYGVSEMTIRRDLQEFEDSGLAVRTHGGAVSRGNRFNELLPGPGSEFQRRIAVAAMEFMPANGTIMLSTGATTLEIARKLAAAELRLGVITNSLPAAATLFRTEYEVMLTGGSLRRQSMDLVGPITENNIDQYYMDVLFSGCDGASSETGFYTSDLNMAAMEKKSVSRAGKVILVTESTKFGRKSFSCFAELSKVDVVITDSRLADADRRNLEAVPGLQLVLV